MNSNINKLVYIPMRADIIHPALINIINKGASLGKVIIGLLTDDAICSYTRPPQLSYEDRKKILECLKNIYKIIPQKSLDCCENLLKIKPNILLHGDDWKEGFQSQIRKKAVKLMKNWKGKIFEIPYDKNNNQSKINKITTNLGTTPEIRRVGLRKLLASKEITKIIEVHNALTGNIAEFSYCKSKGRVREFDAMWASSLTDSTVRAKPDIEAVDISSRVSTLNEIFESTTKPLIFDGDTGGKCEHLSFTIKSLERLGVSAIVIEDKAGLKKNSLFGNEVKQIQDDIKSFSHKIETAKKSQATEDFMIIARIESLILEKGMNDAIARAKAYINAGADAILIHSKQKTPKEVFEFSKKYNKFGSNYPLFCVPTSYSKVKESDLINNGFKAVIYANQLIRAAYPAMQKAAVNILEHKRAYESENNIMTINEILDLIPGTR